MRVIGSFPKPSVTPAARLAAGYAGGVEGLLVLLLLVAAGVAVAVSVLRSRRRLEQRRLADLGAARAVADEDVTRFGEELQVLDAEMLVTPLDTAMRQDYQRALDSYESAKLTLGRTERAEDVTAVTRALEDGRYAVACVLARKNGDRLPVRRPPCFFNPSHGPSIADVDWAPPAGLPRPVPVCAADQERLRQGAEPDIRTVPDGVGRVPYWQAGPAYSPWAMGYFGGYAGSQLLPSFMVLTLLSPTWDGHPVEGADTDFGAGDAIGTGHAADSAGAVGSGDPGSHDTGAPEVGAGDAGGWEIGGWDGLGGFDGF
jgi:hypothetical protein